MQVGAADKKITLLMVGLDNAGKTCTAKTIVGEVNIVKVLIMISMIMMMPARLAPLRVLVRLSLER